MTPPGSAGTAADRYRVPETTGRHRAPPEPPPPPKVTVALAIAAAVLVAASLGQLAAADVTDQAQAAVHATVTTTARVERTVAGPLAVPSVGVVAPVVQEMYGTPEPVIRPLPSIRTRTTSVHAPTPSVPSATATGPGNTIPVTTTAPTVHATPSEPTVSADDTTTAPPVIAAATSSATPEEPTVTATPTPAATTTATVSHGKSGRTK